MCHTYHMNPLTTNEPLIILNHSSFWTRDSPKAHWPQGGNNANDTNNYLHADLALYLKRTRIARMHVRVGTLTWGLLNENDTNEIKMDPIRGFVNTHCLCLVLEIESLYSFSPTIGKQAFIVLTYRKSFIFFLAMAKFKQACFAHDLSKKFHTFYTHVIFGCTRHSSNKFGSALVGTKILRSTI